MACGGRVPAISGIGGEKRCADDLLQMPVRDGGKTVTERDDFTLFREANTAIE